MWVLRRIQRLAQRAPHRLHRRQHRARSPATLEPAIVTLGVVYVMVWGYLQLTGQIEEPFIGGVKRIITLAVILGCALNSGSTTRSSSIPSSMRPAQLAAVVVGAYRPGRRSSIRSSSTGGDAANLLLAEGRLLRRRFRLLPRRARRLPDRRAHCASTRSSCWRSRASRSRCSSRWGRSSSRCCFFETTKRFFEAWLAQLANYAFITILTVLVAALMLHVVTVAAQQAVSDGRGDPDRARGARVHGRGAHVPRDAPGHADGGGTRERTGAEHLRGRECGARLGLRAARCAAPGSLRAGLTDRDGNALGSAEPQGRLRRAAWRRDRALASTRWRDNTSSKERVSMRSLRWMLVCG